LVLYASRQDFARQERKVGPQKNLSGSIARESHVPNDIFRRPRDSGESQNRGDQQGTKAKVRRNVESTGLHSLINISITVKSEFV